MDYKHAKATVDYADNKLRQDVDHVSASSNSEIAKDRFLPTSTRTKGGLNAAVDKVSEGVHAEPQGPLHIPKRAEPRGTNREKGGRNKATHPHRERIMTSIFHKHVSGPVTRSLDMMPHVKYEQISVSDVADCVTLQEAESLIKHNWQTLLHEFQHMQPEQLHNTIEQAHRDIKINCLRKGDGLVEPASIITHNLDNLTSSPTPTSPKLGFFKTSPKMEAPSSPGFMRGSLKRNSTSGISPLLTNSNSPPITDLIDFVDHTQMEENKKQMTEKSPLQNVIMILADGSGEADKALEAACKMVVNPLQEHVIILVPWNSRLPAGIMNAISANSFKYHISNNNCNVLLKSLLWEQARNIAKRYERVLNEMRPELDYSVLIAAGEATDTVVTIGEKYAVSYIVVGRSLENQQERKITPYFGSESFVHSLQKALGSKCVVMVV
ncbi:hypothetical protein PROFUN_11312 [Planoprotostelium fungivorum]|uniref:Uncharacterized protein n=1 Tax=Planoprotostelium fungivorum TaxID=1890364 RepID=A0A2P6N2M7_9EUKA|nr:hypothetical protein PROFUN_11312 [Planoprotostelium fungivorum]